VGYEAYLNLDLNRFLPENRMDKIEFIYLIKMSNLENAKLIEATSVSGTMTMKRLVLLVMIL
jgi:hypothetical protein